MPSHDPYAPHRVYVGGDTPDPDPELTAPPAESTGDPDPDDVVVPVEEMSDDELRAELSARGLKVDGRLGHARLVAEVTKARAGDDAD